MKIGRNDPCHCGSGKKYKHCCYAKDSVKHEVPEEVADEAAAAPDEAADAATANAPEGSDAKKRDSHDHGRGRFHGASRGSGGSFSPRVFRGSQRGG